MRRILNLLMRIRIGFVVMVIRVGISVRWAWVRSVGMRVGTGKGIWGLIAKVNICRKQVEGALSYGALSLLGEIAEPSYRFSSKCALFILEITPRQR